MKIEFKIALNSTYGAMKTHKQILFDGKIKSEILERVADLFGYSTYKHLTSINIIDMELIEISTDMDEYYIEEMRLYSDLVCRQFYERLSPYFEDDDNYCIIDADLEDAYSVTEKNNLFKLVSYYLYSYDRDKLFEESKSQRFIMNELIWHILGKTF